MKDPWDTLQSYPPPRKIATIPTPFAQLLSKETLGTTNMASSKWKLCAMLKLST